MTAYVIGHLRPTYPHTDIADYMDRVVATFEPYGGEFLVHGTRHEVLEGTWEGGVVVVGFPDLEAAHAWWDSSGYRAIAPLRSRHIDGDIVVVDGVAPGYRPAAAAAEMREAAAAVDSRAVSPAAVDA